jgi:hypothetical protein
MQIKNGFARLGSDRMDVDVAAGALCWAANERPMDQKPMDKGVKERGVDRRVCGA